MVVAEPPLEIDNPAGRLHLILKTLRGIDSNTMLIDAWPRVFGLDTGKDQDLGTLMEHVAQVPRMAYETKQLVESIPDEDPYVYLAHFGEVEETTKRTIHLHNPIQWALDAMSQTGWHSLAACARLLHRKAQELMPEPDRMADLVDTFRDLIEEVRQADDLDEGTKDFVLKHLVAVLRRLEDVRFFGVQAVVSAADEMAGAVIRRPDVGSRVFASKVWPRVRAGLLALDLLLNLSANAIATAAVVAEDQPPQPPAVIVTIIEQCAPRELTSSPHGN